MTKRITRIALSITAALALAAGFGATAQAAKHQNKGPIKFTAASTAPVNLESEGAGEVTCTSETATGEITSAVSGHETAVLSGCATEGKQCQSAAQPAGTIKTEELATEIGYINRAKGEVGTDFKAAAGEFLAKFDCPGTSAPDIYIAIKESMIGRLEPVNVISVTGETSLKGALARQEVERFEGAPKDTLLFEVSDTGQAGFEKGEFLPFTGDENLHSIATNAEQEEVKGAKVKKYPDATKVITTGAHPEYARCRKSHGGKWKDVACKERAPEKNGQSKGRYELFPVPS